MTLLAFPSLQTVFDVDGKPVRGAKAYFYNAGTSAPIAVHKVSTLDSPYTQPVPVTGVGRFPPIFTNAATYRVRILDAFGGLVEDIDGISGTSEGGGGGGGSVGGVVDANSLLMTGDVLWNLKGGTRAGFVRLNGRHITSAIGPASGAEFASDTTQALFLYLWDAIPSLAVSGGRGVSAAVDWAANKALSLPDLRGRAPFGVDSMGSTAAGRLTGGLLSVGTVDTVGGTGGEAASTAPLPAHTHTVAAVAIAASGAHSHTVSGSTDTTPNHTHTVPGGGGSFPVTGGAANVAGTGSQTTGGNGAHSHTISGTAASATHTHTVPGHTTDSQGAGGAHNTLPPFMLGTWFCRL